MVQQQPDVRFAQVLEQLLTERYYRNRAALARAAHVSPSALSQYARGRATPSLEVLVHLAGALEVSIDYLVFGQEQDTSAPELGFLSSQLEAGIRKSQTDASALYDLVARVGARLSQQIRAAAQELLPEAVSGTGMLTVEEVTMLESCSTQTVIVTPSLDTEVLVLTTPGQDETAAPGPFTEVVVENIEERRSYEYFVPTGRDHIRRAGYLRQEVIDKSGLQPNMVDRFLKIRHVSRACAPGYVIYSLAVADLQRRADVIYDRILPFISPGSGPGLGYLATVEPASRSYRNFGLLDAAVIPNLLIELEDLRRSSTTTHRELDSPREESR